MQGALPRLALSDSITWPLHPESRASGTNTRDPGANRRDQSLGTWRTSSSISIGASQIDQLFISIRPLVILGCGEKVAVRTSSDVVSQVPCGSCPFPISVYLPRHDSKGEAMATRGSSLSPLLGWSNQIHQSMTRLRESSLCRCSPPTQTEGTQLC